MVAGPREDEEDDVRDVVRAHHPGERLLCPPSSRFESEVRGDAARADIRAPDAAFAQLVVEGTGEADLGELRCAVDGLERKTAASGFRGERDDVCLAALEQMRQGGADSVERPLDVDVDHLLDEVGCEFEEETVRSDARTPHEDVESS